DRFSGDIDDRRMSLGEHLEELRKHVWKAVIWIVLALVVCLCFQSQLMEAATYPFKSCMKELIREKREKAALQKGAGSKLVDKAIDELEKRDDLDERAKRLEQNSVILKAKIAQNPLAVVDDFTSRRKELEKRQDEIEREQTELLGHPDADKVRALEAKRLAL